MARTKIDPNSFPARLAATYRDLESAQAEHSRQALTLLAAPDNTGQQRIVAELEAEIAQHRLAIERLQAAEVASKQQVTAEDLQAKAELHQDRAAKVRKHSARISQLATAMVQAVEVIGPLLAEFQAESAERRQTSWAALVAAVGGATASKRFGSRLMMLDGHHELASALVHAIASSGLGTVGPNLAPGVTVSPPMGPYPADQMVAQLAKRAQQLDDLLASVLEPANVEGDLA